MEPQFIHEYKEIYGDSLSRARTLIIGGYWHLKKNKLDFKNKIEDFHHIQNTAEGVVESLEIFLDAAEGERGIGGVQPYINEILDTINIHLDRLKKYYPLNLPAKLKTKEDQRAEGKFQQLIFKGEQKIKAKLRTLNVENNMEGFHVEFFNDEVATLPMMSILCSLFPDIAAKVESLDIDWDLVMDNGMYINIPKAQVPDYNPKKHFWDQDLAVLQFYVSEWNKIKNGVIIDGYHLNGWLYDHLNYFKTPIGDKGDDIMNPPLRDNEWYWHEILKDAEKKARDMEDAGVFIFGTRRYGKSSCEASMVYYKLKTNPAKNGTLTATNSEDIESITDKINIALEYCHPAFYVNTTSKDWSKKVSFGLKTKGGRNLKLFNLNIINTDSGSKRGGQKTAGGAPVVFVMDEAGKESFLKAYNAAIPSFETSTGWKCIPFFVGTGGDEDLSSEAEKVLANPKAFRFIEMDWDLLERNIPKEAITWNRRTFGWFIPAQMGYKKGFKRIKRTFADFLGIESKELSNIDIYQTDWINNTAVCKADRERLKGDKTQLQQETVFYPLDPEECFMSAKKNPFPASGIKRHKEKLQKEGDPIYGLGRPIGLERNKQNSNKIDMFLDTTRQVATFPHDGSHVDCPFVLYDDFPETRPTDPNRFVAGCLTPGEQVLTDKGLMNVEDINFSNKLINKEGKLVDILALQVHEKVEEDIYTIKVGNSYRETTFTKEHPIFVSRPKFYEGGVSKGRTKQFNFGKEKFLKASEVSVGDWIKYPNIYKQPNPYNTERMMDLGELKYNSTVNSVLDNGDFWKFLGMYLKSGYIAKRGDKSLVHIYFGHQETEQIEDCIDTVLRVFGKECFKKVEGGEIRVEFENKQLYYFLKYSFGKTAQSKCLPEWAKYVGSYFKYQLIFGYLNAPIGSTPIMEFTNKSLILLEGIQDILFSLGVVSNLTLLHKSGAVMTPDGLTHKVKETYILKIDEADEVELRNPIKGKNNCFLSEDLNYIYFKVKSIKKSTYTGKVYNFECETNTFLTPHITTHNCDDYKQDESNGDSIGAFYIFDRLKRKIVLGLATRPDPHTDFHKQMHMALDAWNCKSFMENEDMDFKKYLDRVTQPVLYLHKGFDAYDDFSKFQNGTRKFGWRPDKNTTPLVKGYAVDYTRDDVDHEDNLGNISHTVAGYERIEDIQLLEEMVKNKAGGNFDRLVAFGSCLAIDYYLTSKFITPRTNTQKTKDKEEVDTYGKSRRRGFFSNTRRRLF